jgi:hypothetical protein
VTDEDVAVRPDTYLGDAVYASFDGYQIWLRTADGQDMRIALEPSVYFALRAYAKTIWGEKA